MHGRIVTRASRGANGIHKSPICLDASSPTRFQWSRLARVMAATVTFERDRSTHVGDASEGFSGTARLDDVIERHEPGMVDSSPLSFLLYSVGPGGPLVATCHALGRTTVDA